MPIYADNARPVYAQSVRAESDFLSRKKSALRFALASEPQPGSAQSRAAVKKKRIQITPSLSMDMPETWTDHKSKGMGGPGTIYFGMPDATSAKIIVSEGRPSLDYGKLGSLIVGLKPQLIFEDKPGSSPSNLAKQVAVHLGPWMSVNQLATDKDPVYHISRVELILIEGTPALRIAMHARDLPMIEIIMPRLSSKEEHFSANKLATSLNVTYSAKNEEDFNKDKELFETVLSSIH